MPSRWDSEQQEYVNKIFAMGSKDFKYLDNIRDLNNNPRILQAYTKNKAYVVNYGYRLTGNCQAMTIGWIVNLWFEVEKDPRKFIEAIEELDSILWLNNVAKNPYKNTIYLLKFDVHASYFDQFKEFFGDSLLGFFEYTSTSGSKMFDGIVKFQRLKELYPEPLLVKEKNEIVEVAL